MIFMVSFLKGDAKLIISFNFSKLISLKGKSWLFLFTGQSGNWLKVIGLLITSPVFCITFVIPTGLSIKT
jgi:hypothetical protein